MKRVSNAKLIYKDGTISYQYLLHGVEAVYALGTALILDRKKKLTSRLKQCGNPDCLRFNLDLEPKGRPRRFCDNKCKKIYDNYTSALRVKRYRAKKKALGNSN